MNPLDMLFNQVRGAIEEHGSDRTPGPSYDTGGILGQLSGIFGQHAQSNGDRFDSGSQYGGQFGNVKSSDEDPYGDPGAQGGGSQNTNYGGQFGNVKSSDEDPYGDPGAR